MYFWCDNLCSDTQLDPSWQNQTWSLATIRTSIQEVWNWIWNLDCYGENHAGRIQRTSSWRRHEKSGGLRGKLGNDLVSNVFSDSIQASSLPKPMSLQSTKLLRSEGSASLLCDTDLHWILLLQVRHTLRGGWVRVGVSLEDLPISASHLTIPKIIGAGFCVQLFPEVLVNLSSGPHPCWASTLPGKPSFQATHHGFP